MSDLDRLRSLGDHVVPPSFEVLRETARRGTRRNALAASVVAAAAVAAMVAGGAAIRSMDRAQEPVDQPSPHPTPTETVETPPGQRTVLADIGPGDIGGWELVASRTNTQPGYEGATDLTLVGDQMPWDDTMFCRGDPDTWWVFLTVLDGGDGGPRAGDGAMTDGSRGTFGQCSQNDPTAPPPPDDEIDPSERFDPAESYALRMFVTGPLSEEAQRCLATIHAVSCPATHGIEPLAQTDAVFGFGDFEEKRTPYVLEIPGLAPYRAVMIPGDRVEYVVDRAVIAADNAEQLVVRLPASDGRRIVSFGAGTTPAWDSCVERVGEPAPEVGGFDRWQRELARECGSDVELRIDGVEPSQDDRYAMGQFAVPAGAEHVVTVHVVKGDPRFVRLVLIIWEERR